MKILVTMKQVPDTNDVKIDPKTGRLIREGVPSIINPDDLNALEAALKLKEDFDDISVTVLSMGPPQAEDALRECLAMGVDEAILLSDRAFAGADTWATSLTLAKAAQALGGFDAVIAGRQAIDGDTAQVGPQMAEHLELTQVTYVQKIEFDGKKTFTLEKQTDHGHEVIEVDSPCVLTCIKELNEPRFPTIGGIVDAYREKEVKKMSAAELDCDPEALGAKGSPTSVVKTFTPTFDKHTEVLEGSTQERAAALLAKLMDHNILQKEKTA